MSLILNGDGAISGLTATGISAVQKLPAGSVLQVVSTTKTDAFSTTATGDVDITGLSLTITPTSASSKFLVMTKIMVGNADAQNTTFVLQMRRNNTLINFGTSSGSRAVGFSGSEEGISTNIFGQYQTYDYSSNFLDSPNTTSALTYKTSVFLVATTTFCVNRTAVDGDNANYPRGTSNITVMEIAA